jgi:hypothetical protein
VRRLKVILPLALMIAVAAVAVSLADGGGTEAAPQAPQPYDAPAHDPDVMGVVADVRDAAAKEAPEVAGPIIARSEKAGNITAKQADDLRAAADGLAAGKSPRELAPTVDLRDWDVRVVIRDSFEALKERAPAIANPIVDEAVKSGKITAAQGAEVRDKVSGHGRRGCRKGERENAPVGDQI